MAYNNSERPAPEDRPAEEEKFVFSVVEKRSATRMQLN